MKKSAVSLAILATLSSSAFADTQKIEGSDTLSGVMTSAITSAGLQNEVSYVGGGSGNGEKAILAKSQAIAPMSRAFKPEALAKAKAAGIEVIEHKVALDALGVFVNKSNPVNSASISLLKKIFACEVTTWEAAFPSSAKKGPLKVYRRNDNSGTTDTFKSLVMGSASFGACATAVEETLDIAKLTSSDANAIGFAGLSGATDGNRALMVSKDGSNKPAIPPQVKYIRTMDYPLSRYLYVYEAKGSVTPTTAEAELLSNVLERGFFDTILQEHGFITLD
jgi:phosphate transport system substrate-binding protein